jgi:hypothetical protein
MCLQTAVSFRFVRLEFAQQLPQFMTLLDSQAIHSTLQTLIATAALCVAVVQLLWMPGSLLGTILFIFSRPELVQQMKQFVTKMDIETCTAITRTLILISALGITALGIIALGVTALQLLFMCISDAVNVETLTDTKPRFGVEAGTLADDGFCTPTSSKDSMTFARDR